MGEAHLAAIVTLPAGVLQRVKGDVRVLIQEHLELACTDAQVILIKFIWYVPPYWTKLAPFLQGTSCVGELYTDSCRIQRSCNFVA